MYALKMVGLVTLGALCLGIFLLGHESIKSLSKKQKVKDEALRIHEKIEYVITTGISKKISVKIPKGEKIKFSSHCIEVNGEKIPENGYNIPIKSDNIGSGKIELRISISGGKLLVKRENDGNFENI